MEHPNSATVRQFLTAWFQGDFESWGRLAAPEILIHMRGKPTLNGSYRGREGVMEFFGKFAALNIEGFRFEVEDAVADDRFGMAILRSVYERGGVTLDLRNACAYRLDPDGRIAEVWNVSDKQEAEHDFFAFVEVPAGA